MSDESKPWMYSFTFTQPYLTGKEAGEAINEMLDQYPILKEFLKDE
jgi:hypothetical protein